MQYASHKPADTSDTHLCECRASSLSATLNSKAELLQLQLAELETQRDCVVGDSLLGAVLVTYAGALDEDTRCMVHITSCAKHIWSTYDLIHLYSHVNKFILWKGENHQKQRGEYTFWLREEKYSTRSDKKTQQAVQCTCVPYWTTDWVHTCYEWVIWTEPAIWCICVLRQNDALEEFLMQKNTDPSKYFTTYLYCDLVVSFDPYAGTKRWRSPQTTCAEGIFGPAMCNYTEVRVCISID